MKLVIRNLTFREPYKFDCTVQLRKKKAGLHLHKLVRGQIQTEDESVLNKGFDRADGALR